MKLCNKSAISDSTLTALLKSSARAVGAKSSRNVLIKVQPITTYSHCGSSGVVHNWCWISDKLVSGRSDRRISCDCYMVLRVPDIKAIVKFNKHLADLGHESPYEYDWLKQAESIYAMFCHEWNHVKDHQQGIRYVRPLGQKRQRHDSRPWEIAANKAARRAKTMIRKDAKRQDLIISLALELESLIRG